MDRLVPRLISNRLLRAKLSVADASVRNLSEEILGYKEDIKTRCTSLSALHPLVGVILSRDAEIAQLKKVISDKDEMMAKMSRVLMKFVVSFSLSGLSLLQAQVSSRHY